ncbi:hypothetical protein ACQPYK_36205 [Streptosporangium sp. CA-135522]|uniref:hypothetical protein n=1 Tax=Streptosporangium sp. CA-135522 TaxID=3240072 RepID=UPI003D89F808
MNGKRPSVLTAAFLAAVTLWPGEIATASALADSTGAVGVISVQSDSSHVRRCWSRGPLICCHSWKGVRCHRSPRARRRDLDDLHDEWRDRHRRDDRHESFHREDFHHEDFHKVW